MMRHLLYIICIALLSLTKVGAQECAITIEPKKVDFGFINESDGATSRTFTITNSGSKSIVVSEIISTCDCTIADYSDVTISPNSSFEVSVMYDPTNRPGRFDRTLFVMVDGYDTPFEVQVIGRVTPREKSIEERYRDMGHGLYAENTFAPFPYLEHGKRYEERIAIYNNSSRTMRLRITSYAQKSGLLRVEYPERLEPKAHADVVFIYELPADSRKYGDVDDDLVVYVDKLHRCGYLLSAHGIAVDNFDEVDYNFSPSADYSKKVINFGDVNADIMPLSATLTITNTGGAPLFIRDVRCNEEWAVKHTIKPGDEIAVGQTKVYDIKLDLGENYTPLSNYGTSTLLSGNMPKGKPFNARISITTNDAITPYQVITLKAQYHDAQSKQRKE